MGGSSESEVPLLLPLPLPLAKESNQREDGGWWGEATAEAGRLAALAAPMIAVALLQLMMQLISTIMVGHLGEVPLAGAAIATEEEQGVIVVVVIEVVVVVDVVR
ncbi:hypothetical protein PR202_ga31288 [Eleusine coracana subsp. coracana]|uniref:Uncharacterized protein n=1 Tax=Eleusine coracana subsp. coracana TaxID=191504 RepID=A0AAV5DPM0_ELECO|nr:hypothetical protein PR202_ga31288 [Eleusine coracana subsp. coracana]